MMTDQDKILALIKTIGPLLPTKVAKNLGTDILIASAHLSDLKSQGKIKISYLKIGGSPLYFLAGQERELFEFAQGNMKSQDYGVLVDLKNKEVLRESDLDVLPKVALRGLRDFSVPLHVTVGGKKEIFWKWHLLNDEDTNQKISLILRGGIKDNDDLAQVKEAEEKADIEESKEILSKVKEVEAIEISKKEVVLKAKVQDVKKKEDEQKVIIQKAEGKSEIKAEIKSEIKSEAKVELEEKPKVKVEVELVTEDKAEVKSFVDPSVEPSVDIEVKDKVELASETALKTEKSNSSRQEEFEKQPEIQKKLKKPFLQKIREKVVGEDKFLVVIKQYLADLEIRIEDYEIIRKNSEINFTVKIPSIVGSTKYYCKAKSKKRCDEKDISLAYMESQVKKLPLLFLYTTEMNKKSMEMLESGVFENTTIKKVSLL